MTYQMLWRVVAPVVTSAATATATATVATVAALCAIPAAHAQAPAAWPTKPITMIVPFPPGGVADTVARPVAEAMSRSLGQTVVVENRAGAGGGLGMAQVAKAAPDGYTVMMTLSSISIIPEADVILGRAPMYQLNQFTPIARFTADPTVLVVRADAPWKDAKEFIAAQKKGDREVTYGSSGNYGSMHVPMEMLRSQADIRLLHVPYTGAGPAVVALLGGQVDAVSTGPASVLQYISAGKLRALAHWGEGRLASMPDVPSLTELGYPVQFAQWSGLFAPANTPPAVVEALRNAARTASTDSRVLAAVQGAGSPIQYLDAPAFKTYWDGDAKTLVQVVRKIGKVE
ncbi:tripartite tricarboxylate transporter substrate binding protein [Pigmentiphaga litoralis]|uniref:Tripartite-type tricarboxylate transporter receptor subunit TctC n=1 Tax=Pigmentiphaga litoralis TaxID=516702 RepID=A0A7Y9LNU5_9BURK|nr:tripartite tricarboxylate transporter substrate binding protein [Pigmentiphaga litoralis]NYE25947.1 tripartite-type tricarboxylate transporter receptor subunit TctC [Pigmentiphaga litoralis]NYE85067.1 tripartite-type tricarboxylate transporter receptor subunit TctC [Pigmentiphaga litoralis]